MKSKILIILVVVLFTVSCANDSNDKEEIIDNNSEVIVDNHFEVKKSPKPGIYPDTTLAPVLELTWPGKLDPTKATRFTPYGIWENEFDTPEGRAYEQANEMQFYILTDEEDFLAVAPGIVTQNQVFENGYGLVSVQYGQNYAVTYMHMVPNPELNVGDQTKIGDVMGKMEKRVHNIHGEETWWEIMFTTQIDGKYRTLPPYDYFSSSSQEMFNQIAENSKEKSITNADVNTWTVREDCSWIKYTMEPSWWDSGRFLDRNFAESHQDFLDSLGLGWKDSDKSLVIGPTDKCR